MHVDSFSEGSKERHLLVCFERLKSGAIPQNRFTFEKLQIPRA